MLQNIVQHFQDGIKHGMSTSWYSNGQMESSCMYRNGFAGMAEERDENGNRIGIGHGYTYLNFSLCNQLGEKWKKDKNKGDAIESFQDKKLYVVADRNAMIKEWSKVIDLL